MRLNSILILIIIFTSSCIELFIPETVEYEDVLFIEALITDDPTIPPHVLISKTLPLATEDSEALPRSSVLISGASVKMLCDDGSSYDFVESERGRYLPTDPLFVGEIDKSYRVSILYNNQTFESGYELLQLSPPIDSLTSEIVHIKASDDGELIYGMRFFASTHDNDDKDSYYRWLLDATYSYNVPFSSTHRYVDGEIVIYENNDLLECYMNKKILGLYTSSTQGLEENTIIEAPLHFESQFGDELSNIYSLHAKQLRISEPAYKFWNELNRLIYEAGGLYETQPFRLSGNIECVSDENINVIGIFEAAGVSEMREYFFRPQGINIFDFKCELDTIGTEALPWEIVLNGSFLLEDEPGLYFTSDIRCFDCTTRGGTTEVPPFWEY
jgi:hypothetical protein